MRLEKFQKLVVKGASENLLSHGRLSNLQPTVRKVTWISTNIA
jgi:hypothetical protein